MRSFDVSNDRLGMIHGLTQNDAPSPPLTRGPVDLKVPNPQLNTRSPPPPPTGSDNKGESSHTAATGARDDTEKRRKSKFHFKKKHRSDYREGEKRDHRHHRHDHREGSSRPSKRRKHPHERKKAKDDPSAYDDTYLPNLSSTMYADPDEAFRQSLFDAMADDEGAAFWEGVYGEPINRYSRPEVKDEMGMLEKMNDAEYAEYVRRKMWENSHQHILEERERRRREKEEEKERDRDERTAWEYAEKEMLREEKPRKQKKKRSKFQKRWDEYLEDWARIMEGTRADVDDSGGGRKGSANVIPWPIKSGKLSDISQDAVKQFFLSAPTSTEPDNKGFTDMLKLERMRWHPDKAQQRWGKFGLDEEELKGITAVFQAIYSLWIEYREGKASE